MSLTEIILSGVIGIQLVVLLRKKNKSKHTTNKKINFNKIKDYKKGELLPIETVLDYSLIDLWISKKEQKANIEIFYLIRNKKTNNAFILPVNIIEKFLLANNEDDFYISPLIKKMF